MLSTSCPHLRHPLAAPGGCEEATRDFPALLSLSQASVSLLSYFPIVAPLSEALFVVFHATVEAPRMLAQLLQA